ncbi:MAG: UDP-N-acetylglucosamine 1-carboxyvinyltransferase, partial [Deltaproteobacteria bacterium]|nr:UDP-N-acetylglucosamine 1-carboxyvinyltransferase [Deltaproteobacteria bacterium]
MDKLIIHGGQPLHGSVQISGAKNAALPIMAASLLAPGTHTITNVPQLRDITTMLKLLEHLGVEHQFCRGGSRTAPTLSISADNIRGDEAPYDIVRTMRASVLVLGPLVARLRHAKVSLPGGCAIGARPINLHLTALEAMGASVTIHDGYVEVRAPHLHGAHIIFDKVTVTGTENIMMAACMAKGETVIENAAQEPEVPNLAVTLNAMGARIEGAGTPRITIQGVTELRPCTSTIMPDRIEAGTYMMAAAITGGDVTLRSCPVTALETLTAHLREAGVQIDETADGLRVQRKGTLRSVNVTTAPHPGFATDLQAQF